MSFNKSGASGSSGSGAAKGTKMGNDQYDYLFKFIIIGDAGAGKSCLLHQFIEGKFKKSSSHTIFERGEHRIQKLGQNGTKWDSRAGAKMGTRLQPVDGIYPCSEG